MDRWRAVYIERCTYGSGASNGKPAVERRQGACCLAHLMLRQSYTAQAFDELWKRVRKYGGLGSALTQNVNLLLESSMGRNMISNSEFIVMLNQSGKDRDDLAELLGINQRQIRHITNAQRGCGLMKVGDALVPFVDSFPKENPLYRYMTTSLSEVMEYANERR